MERKRKEHMLAVSLYLKFGNMSRLGKKPIEIPSGVVVSREKNTITVKGTKGTISREFFDEVVEINITDKEITITPKGSSKFARSLWGTYASHLRSMIIGVEKPFSKKLILEGIGYKVELSGEKIILSVGFSHKIEVEIPKGLKVEVVKNNITIEGVSKEEVGHFAARVRAYKKPEPYKGKGIRYDDEIIRRKEGKKSV